MQGRVNEPMRAVLNRVSLRDTLKEQIPSGNEPGLGEGKATCRFGSRAMTARVKKEMIFDEDMFVLDLLFSGTKRSISEVTPDD